LTRSSGTQNYVHMTTTLRSFRESRGWSLARLASELALVSKGYLSDIERGAYACPLELALRIEHLSAGEVAARDLVAPAKRHLLGQGAEGAAPRPS